MRIIQIGKYYPPVKGGMETVLRDLCEGLADAGHEVAALVAADGGGDRRERLPGGGELVRCGAPAVVASQPLALSLPHHLRALIERRRPHVVQLHGPNPLAAACLLALRHRLPPGALLTVWHHADVARQRLGRRFTRPLGRRLLAVCDGVCVSSTRLRDTSGELAPRRDAVEVVPFGLDPRRWSVAREGPGEGFLFVGRLVYYKGLEHLLDALHAAPAVRLRIVGDGPLRPRLAQRIAAEGLAERVSLLGERSDAELRDLYRDARALVLPSDHPSETFGVVQLEAMAAGLPVISTSLPTGVAGVNLPGTTGLQVPPGDAAALAAALRRLEAEPETARSLGEAGRAHVARHYHRDRMVGAVLAWYARLAARHDGGIA